MKTIKRPRLVMALNVAVVVILGAAVAYAVHRANTPAATPPIQVIQASTPASGVGAPGAMQAIPRTMQLAITASREYQNHDYASSMRDSDIALGLIRSEKQDKETHLVRAQIALTAARAAKASGSVDAEARYLVEIKSVLHDVQTDPASYPADKKGAQEILDAALGLEGSNR